MRPAITALVALLLPLGSASAPSQETNSVGLPDDYMLLTVVLKHDQSKNLDQIGQELKATGFWARFPPEGIEVDSWYVVMGLGQVVTLKVPPARLREVNRVIEQTAWGAFRTEFYPSYDLSEAAKEFRERAKTQ